ncbi:MAG: precorrin-2 C(20)-methyltransferase [bacterium]|nr:precorrin-2 C(20)-methyltransferase [bacterium]
MPGKLYGVGVGPGDPELMTLKAVRIIEECPVIVAPSDNLETCVAYNIAKGAVNTIDQKEVLAFHMPMTKDKKVLNDNYDYVAASIMEHLDAGKDVAVLTLGDPTVYSTYIYIHHRVEKAGYETQIISGITSFCATAASLNMSLVERSEPLHIYPGTYNLEEMFEVTGTKVLMKSASKFIDVKERLQESNMDLYMVENCGLRNEKKCYGIENFPEKSSYYTVIVSKEKEK